MEPIMLVGTLFILIFSVIIHECSHGIAALRNGDDTARIMGRLTLNPLPHIDLFGTIILPGILFLAYVFNPSPHKALIMLGWAKPVPINPFRFRDFRKGMLEVGAAGPLSNIILALCLSFLFRITGSNFHSGAGLLFLYGIFINFLLALFNLIPVPPLDGSRILGSLLPVKMEAAYYRLERYGIFIIVALLFLGILDFLGPVVASLVTMVTGTSIF